MASITQPSSASWDYAPAPESFRPEIAAEHGLFIGGAFVKPKSGKFMKVINPATEETLTKVAEAGKADVAAAVEAATKAQRKWAKLPGKERAKYRSASRVVCRSAPASSRCSRR